MSNPLRFSESDYRIFIFALAEQTDKPLSPVVMFFQDKYYEVMTNVAPENATKNPIIQFAGEDYSEMWFSVFDRYNEKYYIEIIINKMPMSCELENSSILGNTYNFYDVDTND